MWRASMIREKVPWEKGRGGMINQNRGGGKSFRENKYRVRPLYGASEGQLLSLSLRKQNNFRMVFPHVFY